MAMAGLLKFKRVFPARQHYPEISTPVTRSPSGLPAAASSLLFAKGRAPIASIVEMCQRGTLHIEAVARGQMDYFTYRLTVRDRTRYPWEQTFCRAIPTMAVSSDLLITILDRSSSAMAEQLEERLRAADIFNHVSDPPIVWPKIVARVGWFGATVALVPLSIFLVISILTQGGALGSVLWIIIAIINLGIYCGMTWEHANAIIEYRMVTLTDHGIREIANWRAFREYLSTPRSHGDGRPPDSLLPYVAALTAGDRWLDHVPAWFEITGEGQLDERCRLRREAYREFMSAAKSEETTRYDATRYLTLGSDNFDADIDVDIDLAFS